MQIRGRIIASLPLASGTNRNGQPWSKATIVVETAGQYPKKVALNNLKKAEEFARLPIGATATFEIEIESREYNGRWYTEANCWSWNIEY